MCLVLVLVVLGSDSLIQEVEFRGNYNTLLCASSSDAEVGLGSLADYG